MIKVKVRRAQMQNDINNQLNSIKVLNDVIIINLMTRSGDSDVGDNIILVGFC